MLKVILQELYILILGMKYHFVSFTRFCEINVN